MAKIIECRDCTDDMLAKREVLGEFVKNGRKYTFSHSTAGYECAGAMMRETGEYWAVRFYFDGAIHGRRFSTEEEARIYMAQVKAS